MKWGRIGINIYFNLAAGSNKTISRLRKPILNGKLLTLWVSESEMGIFGYRICAHFVYSIETETEIIKPSRIQKQINHMEKLFFFLCYYIWLTKPQIELINVLNGMRKFAFVDNIHMNVILSWCFFFLSKSVQASLDFNYAKSLDFVNIDRGVEKRVGCH